MGYWVSSKPEHFLEGMFIMEKYEFFLFLTVYSLFSKTASISTRIYSGVLIQTPTGVWFRILVMVNFLLG